MKRLFIVHRWGGSSNEPLIAWLGKQGVREGYETTVLDMPGSEVPTIDKWVGHLDSVAQYTDENTYFIGHSIGCQAILRYLETQEGCRVGGMILIAPLGNVLNGLTNDIQKDIVRPWLERAINFRVIRDMGGKSVVIFSDDDKKIPVKETTEFYTNGLGPKIVILSGRGHFKEKDGVMELPEVIEELRAM